MTGSPVRRQGRMRAPACEAVLGLHAAMRRNGAERVREGQADAVCAPLSRR